MEEAPEGMPLKVGRNTLLTIIPGITTRGMYEKVSKNLK